MATKKAEKRKAKRKAKQKNRRLTKEKVRVSSSRSMKSEFYAEEARFYWNSGDYERAFANIQKALKTDPQNKTYLQRLVDVGRKLDRNDVVLSGYTRLYNIGQLDDEDASFFVRTLIDTRDYHNALQISEIYLAKLPEIKIANKRKIKSYLIDCQRFCQACLENEKHMAEKQEISKSPVSKKDQKQADAEKRIPASDPDPDPVSDKVPKKQVLPKIPVSINLDTQSFQAAFSSASAAAPEVLELAMEGYRIRFRDSFENLICLSQLSNVRSFWYQEETARKVLKSFRGRAMLSDEVGLGKTIEASIILKEYIERGMVKNALILTPTPLVSQWKEELAAKFNLDFVSTDDQDLKNKNGFWQSDFVLASINQAKSKKNFSQVTEQEYDMVIVDEAHHLKNKNTLNWKLVNSLKKRFLLLLTATPVENNLMELYNLITLLKPGLLKTASDFRKEFVTKGNPTSPQNRNRLKGLLDRVMIRNTRSLARIDIPPRFAYTVRVEPGASEKKLYTMVTDLVSHINQTGRSGSRLLLKNLLAEAGSSPKALDLTLYRIIRDGKYSLEDFHDKIEPIHNLCRSITGETGKNKALLKLIKKAKGKKIIFVKYVGSMEQISEFLAWHNIPHALFHGSMDNKKKDEAIRLFKEEKDILVSTEIGGEGRNLQFCHQMVNYDLPWNPMKIEQRIGRIHRIGQEKEVMIYNFCALGSVEDYILEILDRKINMFEMVIGEIDMILGRVRGEKDFEDMVYDIWVNSGSEKERDKEFGNFGARIKRSKIQYTKTRELDDQLFGENYEL
ncbi:hypothetical protein BuS5_00643 [Desulfosarcina sp. BuS5]|uniref:SNF2-related protein n=1 Tax=Desulfosarcina sp. BuS5 TaxID=933262 RepID=UPI0004814914|nr:SNF2-related protein [Desulfosarcina sp. BuS5]WDN87675.1 hypothetical protein BuS5_00643 [Desulfosarcina sp. BuS5]